MARILIRNLSFSYPLRTRKLRTPAVETRSEISVFSDFCLEVGDGIRLAILGRNGAGKTTLLKLIAGILPPTKGTLCVDGAVSPLLNVQLGMESELTGRENIYLRGTYMGRSHNEIGKRLEEIVDFADLGEFIDLPFYTYSAGMRARLAFSIATSFEPEILLIDESVAAGDKGFAERAGRRLHQFVDHSNILLLATHNQNLMKQWCNRALDLSTGEIKLL